MNAYLRYGLSHLSGRGKTRQHRRLAGAIVGVALSLIPLLLVIQVAGGMIQGITNRYIEVASFHLQIRHFAKPDAEEMATVARSVERIDGVTGVYEGYTGIALASGAGGRQGLSIRAVPPDMYSTDARYREYLTMTEGGFLLDTPGAMLLSKKTAVNLGVGPGDSVRLLTSLSIRPGKLVLKQSSFIVTGIFSSGYADIDESTAMIALDDGRRLFRESGAAFIGIKVADPYSEVERIYREINAIAPRDWYPFTWYDLDRSLFKSFQTTRGLLIFVMSFIVLTAAANVSSAMIMMVMEKQEDIALLIAAGASPGRLSRSFLYTGFIIGIIGAFIGCTVGLLVAINVNELISFFDNAVNALVSVFRPAQTPFSLLSTDYYLESIPITIGFAETLGASALAVVCSTLAAFIPAVKASRIDPAAVLARK